MHDEPLDGIAAKEKTTGERIITAVSGLRGNFNLRECMDAEKPVNPSAKTTPKSNP